MSTFMVCLVLSKTDSIDILIPGYSASSLILSTLDNLISTPSSTGIDRISLKTFLSLSSFNSKPLMVASMSIVALASIPTIAAISIPPFNINRSLYSDNDILSNSLSSIKFLRRISALIPLSLDKFLINAFNCVDVFTVAPPSKFLKQFRFVAL